MTAFLDASVVVRYLTGDPMEAAEEASRIIDGAENLQLSDIVLLETAYVLKSSYGLSRELIVDSLVSLLQKENIITSGLETGFVLQGLMLCRPSGRVSFADALIWAAARSGGGRTVYSFDERFPGFELEVRRSAQP